MRPASTTSRQSCSVVRQVNTRNIRSPLRHNTQAYRVEY
jgi:hypothetical protein